MILIVFSVFALSCCSHSDAFTGLQENHSGNFIIYLVLIPASIISITDVIKYSAMYTFLSGLYSMIL